MGYYFNKINKHNIKDVYFNRKYQLSSDYNIYTKNNKLSKNLKKYLMRKLD